MFYQSPWRLREVGLRAGLSLEFVLFGVWGKFGGMQKGVRGELVARLVAKGKGCEGVYYTFCVHLRKNFTLSSS